MCLPSMSSYVVNGSHLVFKIGITNTIYISISPPYYAWFGLYVWNGFWAESVCMWLLYMLNYVLWWQPFWISDWYHNQFLYKSTLLSFMKDLNSVCEFLNRSCFYVFPIGLCSTVEAKYEMFKIWFKCVKRLFVDTSHRALCQIRYCMQWQSLNIFINIYIC